MNSDTMPTAYYLISDLHIGGDEALGVCDFEDELIDFVKNIAQQDENAELIIIGDAFGLWEFTQVEGVEKINKLIEQFPRIFNAFRMAGEKVKITVLPGNMTMKLPVIRNSSIFLKNIIFQLNKLRP